MIHFACVFQLFGVCYRMKMLPRGRFSSATTFLATFPRPVSWGHAMFPPGPRRFVHACTCSHCSLGKPGASSCWTASTEKLVPGVHMTMVHFAHDSQVHARACTGVPACCVTGVNPLCKDCSVMMGASSMGLQRKCAGTWRHRSLSKVALEARMQ